VCVSLRRSVCLLDLILVFEKLPEAMTGLVKTVLIFSTSGLVFFVSVSPVGFNSRHGL